MAVIGIVTVVLAGTNLLGIDLPDAAIRILGVVDIVPVLVYT